MPSRERIKELLPVLQAYADGKAVEWRVEPDRMWSSCCLGTIDNLGFMDCGEYRVAPEPEKVSDGNSGWVVCGIASEDLFSGDRVVVTPVGMKCPIMCLADEHTCEGELLECDIEKQLVRPARQKVSDGSADWKEYGTADGRYKDGEHAWWDDSATPPVWRPRKVREWDPGVRVDGDIPAGSPVEFNGRSLMIRAEKPREATKPSLVVVGVSGVAESGKDTVAKVMDLFHGFTRIALGDGIRASLRDLDGATWDVSKELEKAGVGVRKTMQTFGSEAREDLSGTAATNLWLDVALCKIRYLSHYHPKPRSLFVIPDVRMPHEPPRLKEVVESWGGRYVGIRVNRKGAGLKGDVAKHKSETDVLKLPVDREIVNDGSIEDLALVIKAVANSVVAQS